MTGDLTDPLWGTGYGNKRHLVDTATVRLDGFNRRYGRSRCERRVNYFADAPAARWLGPKTSEAAYVASLAPCVRCQKIADRETTP